MASPLPTAEVPFKARTAQEHCAAIDVNQLAQQGLLTPGRRYLWGWGNPCAACLQVVTQEGCLTLLFQTEAEGPHSQCIALGHSASNFGYRPLLLCPTCGIASYKIYFLKDHFACRACHDLKPRRGSNLVNGDQDPAKFWHKGYLLTSIPSDVAPTAPFWAASKEDGEIENTQNLVCTDNPFLPPVRAEALPPIKHPAAAKSEWKAGRPRRDLTEVACTCGTGTATTGHGRGCPRGALLRRWARREAVRDAQLHNAAAWWTVAITTLLPTLVAA